MFEQPKVRFEIWKYYRHKPRACRCKECRRLNEQERNRLQYVSTAYNWPDAFHFTNVYPQYRLSVRTFYDRHLRMRVVQLFLMPRTVQLARRQRNG